MKFFLTGATGYVGGALAARLLREGHTVRGLVRSEEKARALQARNITPVLGDLENRALLASESKAADAVVNAAIYGHRPSAEAFLEALRSSNKVFLYISGTGILVDDAQGNAEPGSIFDEDTAIDFGTDSFRSTAHQLNSEISSAANSGVNSVILLPSMIYGVGDGLHTESVQLPMMVKQATLTGEPAFIGKGINRWSNVHIDDLVDLCILALTTARAGSSYYVESGAASFKEIADAITKRLSLKPPRSISLQEGETIWGPAARPLLAANSVVRAIRARAELGWTPQYPSIADWITTSMPEP